MVDFLLSLGELPVKVDMSWVPQIHPAAMETEIMESLPPAIPPKMIVAEDLIREQKCSRVQTESEGLVPALPPKPSNNWSVHMYTIL